MREGFLLFPYKVFAEVRTTFFSPRGPFHPLPPSPWFWNGDLFSYLFTASHFYPPLNSLSILRAPPPPVCGTPRNWVESLCPRIPPLSPSFSVPFSSGLPLLQIRPKRPLQNPAHTEFLLSCPPRFHFLFSPPTSTRLPDITNRGFTSLTSWEEGCVKCPFFWKCLFSKKPPPGASDVNQLYSQPLLPPFLG